MNLVLLKKSIITLGIFLFLLGLLMSVSHITSGFEVFSVGIVLLPTGILIPVQKKRMAAISANKKRKNSYLTIIQSVGITGMVILGMLLVFPLKEWMDKSAGKELSSLIGYIISFGIAFMVNYEIRKRKTNVSSINLSIENKRIIPLIIIAAVALLSGIAGPLASFIPMSEFIKNSFLQLVGRTGIWTFILMVIAAPVLEELIFRGIILDGLLKRYTPFLSITVSSVLFGIAHVNPWQFVTGLLIGAFSGWVYYKTKSLAPSIIIHAAANFFGFLMRHFMDIESLNKTGLERYGGSLNFILIITGSIILVSICIYYLQKEFSKENLEIQTNNI